MDNNSCEQSKGLEELIGYTFDNKELLDTAFLTPSKSNECGKPSYQRLEFFGDKIIDMCVSHFLYQSTDLKEGELTVKRQCLVNNAYLARVASQMGISKFIQCSNKQEIVASIEADVFEALTAAIYLDSSEQYGLCTIYDWLIDKFKKYPPACPMRT